MSRNDKSVQITFKLLTPIHQEVSNIQLGLITIYR